MILVNVALRVDRSGIFIFPYTNARLISSFLFVSSPVPAFDVKAPLQSQSPLWYLHYYEELQSVIVRNIDVRLIQEGTSSHVLLSSMAMCFA